VRRTFQYEQTPAGWLCVVTEGELSVEGEGRTQAEAKQDAEDGLVMYLAQEPRPREPLAYIDLGRLGSKPLEPQRANVEALAHSIAHDGRIDPLTVTPDNVGRFRVVEGRRRLAAIRLLVERDQVVWNGHGYGPARRVYETVACEVV
jgi:hypothetical protein